MKLTKGDHIFFSSLFILTLLIPISCHFYYYSEYKITKELKFVKKENLGYIITCRDDEFVLEYNGRNIIKNFDNIPCDEVKLKMRE